MKKVLISFLSTFTFLNNCAAAPLLHDTELKKVPYVHPTTYFVADEEHYKCKAADLVSLKDTKNRELAKVCKRFMKALVMEGTGVLKDRGEGRKTVNGSLVESGEKVFIAYEPDGVNLERCVGWDFIDHNSRNWKVLAVEAISAGNTNVICYVKIGS